MYVQSRQSRKTGPQNAEFAMLKTATIALLYFSDGSFLKFVFGRDFDLLRHMIFGHVVAEMTPEMAKK